MSDWARAITVLWIHSQFLQSQTQIRIRNDLIIADPDPCGKRYEDVRGSGYWFATYQVLKMLACFLNKSDFFRCRI